MLDRPSKIRALVNTNRSPLGDLTAGYSTAYEALALRYGFACNIVD